MSRCETSDLRDLTRREARRPAPDRGDVQHAVKVERPLVQQPVIAEQVAVISREDYDRIVGQAQFVQRIQYAPYLFVDERHHAEGDCRDLAHVRVRHLSGRAPAGRPLVGLIHQAHVGRQVVELVLTPCRRRDRVAVVHGVPRVGRGKGMVRVRERGPEHEGPVLIGGILQIRDAAVGNPRVVVVFRRHVDLVGLLRAAGGRRGGLAVPIGEHVGMLAFQPVVVLARNAGSVTDGQFRAMQTVVRRRQLRHLAVVPHPTDFGKVEGVKGLRIDAERLAGHTHVNLADLVRVVPGVGERAGDGGEGGVQVDAVSAHVVPAGGETREQRGTRGHAERIVHEGAGEQRAAGREPVEIGRLQRGVVLASRATRSAWCRRASGR